MISRNSYDFIEKQIDLKNIHNLVEESFYSTVLSFRKNSKNLTNKFIFNFSENKQVGIERRTVASELYDKISSV